jgi:hypothetical protein
MSTQDVVVTITAGSTGDVYSVTINSNTYSYTQQVGDTASVIATALGALINADLNADSTVVDNAISITTAASGTPFTIHNVGSTSTLNCRINMTIQLPTSTLNNVAGEQLFLPGSIELITASGTVVATDNGLGVFSNGTVDYITGALVIPMTMANGSYYIRYKQNSNQNVFATSKQALTYSLPKTNYADVTELLSTITFE